MRKNKVVIVGGGSTWTPGLLKSLCEKKTEFPLEELRLYDIDAERQAVIGEFAKVLFAEEYPELKFLYTTDKETAYRDVDFVFCQIRTGGFDMRMMDEQIPLAHGVVGQWPRWFCLWSSFYPGHDSNCQGCQNLCQRSLDSELYQPCGNCGGGVGKGIPGR